MHVGVRGAERKSIGAGGRQGMHGCGDGNERDHAHGDGNEHEQDHEDAQEKRGCEWPNMPSNDCGKICSLYPGLSAMRAARHSLCFPQPELETKYMNVIPDTPTIKPGLPRLTNGKWVFTGHVHGSRWWQPVSMFFTSLPWLPFSMHFTDLLSTTGFAPPELSTMDACASAGPADSLGAATSCTGGEMVMQGRAGCADAHREAAA
eukprot:365781-Chlamydomonas_euryale.AAC.3